MKRFHLLFFLALLAGGPADAQSPEVLKTMDIIKNQAKYPHYVLVSAHRGYWADYPENTLEAYRMAMEIGADIIEMDVRMTLDDRMVVFHDACLDRMTTGYGRLREEDWNYVHSLYLRNDDGTVSPYKILALSEALDYLKDKAVIALDIKEGGRLYKEVLTLVLGMLKEKGMLYQSVVKGKLPYAELLSVLDGAGVTLDDFVYTPIAFATTRDLESYIKDYVGSGKIHAMELVYKQSKDPILEYVPLLEDKHIWIGQFSFWPEVGDGVVAEKIPLTDTDPIVRKYDFKDQDPADFLDDGRGNWDWLLSKGANYVVTDRSELLIDMLTKMGRRTK